MQKLKGREGNDISTPKFDSCTSGCGHRSANILFFLSGTHFFSFKISDWANGRALKGSELKWIHMGLSLGLYSRARNVFEPNKDPETRIVGLEHNGPESDSV